MKKICFQNPLLNFALLVCMVLSIQTANSQNTSPTESIKLSGSTSKVEESLSKSNTVFIGKVTKIGFPDLSAAGQAEYGVEVNVLQIFQGSIDAHVAIILHVIAKHDFRESIPKIGDSYLFFVRKKDNAIWALKLLPATDANITKVKALIAAAPTPK